MLSTQAIKSQRSVDTDVVPTAPTAQQTINIVNINKNESNSLLVIHDKDQHKFIIKDNSNILGHFTVGQIFKFINSDIEGYLLDIDLGISVDLIKKYLLVVENDTVVLVSHLDSPITGSIELLVKLYKDIQSFEEQLNIEYENLNEETKKIVKSKNKNFVYGILVHIVKLFATYTTTNKPLSDDTKIMVISYSIGAMYRISSMIKEDMNENTTTLLSLQNDIHNLQQIRENMAKQIQKLSSNLISQNEKIDLLISNIQLQQEGGFASSISSYTSSKTTDSKTTDSTNPTQDSSNVSSYVSSYVSSNASSFPTSESTTSLTLKGSQKTQTITDTITSFLSS